VRFFAVFGPGSFQDVNGNPSAETDSVSFTVTGSPNHFPIHRDWIYEYTRFGFDFPAKDAWMDTVRSTFEDISGDTFDWVWWNYDYFGGGWEVDDREFYRMNSSGLYLRGFQDDGSNIMFTPEILYQDLPMAEGTWSGESTAPMGISLMRVVYNGETEGPLVLAFEDDESDEPNVVFENCYRSILFHSLIVDGAMEPFEDGADTLWFAPGIGLIQEFTGNQNYDEDTISWDRLYLNEIIVD
jgi:hypothetical protein